MSTNINDFLNAKTSVAFGASAAMVVAFTTTLCTAFSLPSAVVAIVLSGVFAIAQVAPLKDKALVKSVFWLLCTMVIFHAARGGNTTLGEAVGPGEPAKMEIVVPDEHASAGLMDFIVPSAYAGGNDAQPDRRYYLSRFLEDGRAVYTNSVGRAVTNAPAQRAFQRWKWSN